MTEIALSPVMQTAIDDGSWDHIEELWLEKLELKPIPAAELLEVRRLLWKAGKKSLARTLLELLAETLETNNNTEGALAAIRELVRLTEKPNQDQLKRLKDAFIKVRAGSPSLEALLSRHPLFESRKPLDELELMDIWLDHEVGTIVEVQGQGVGRVSEINLELGNLKVDIGRRRPVSIPFGAIGRFVRRLPEGDFLRAKVETPDELRERVLADPPGALVHILSSLDGPSEVGIIKEAVEGLIPSSGWTSWWTKARKSPRVLSSGTGSRLRYSVTLSAEDATDSLQAELRSAAPRDRLKAAKGLGTRGKEAAAQTADFLSATLDDLLEKDPGLAWETAELLSTLPGGEISAQTCKEELVASVLPLRLFSGIHDRSARLQALEYLRENSVDDWGETWAEWLLHEKTASILEVLARGLNESGTAEILDSAIETIFRKHLEHPHQFLWATEAMTEENAPEALHRRLRPSLLEKIPDTLSRREFAEVRSRAKGLLQGGKAAIRLILDQATPQQAQRFTQRVARIDAVDPGQIRLVEQAAHQAKGSSNREKAEAILFVATETAVERKRAELRHLLDVEIPKTLKGINAAAAEGDLRENFEYHMLRDRQELQSARAAKIQEELGRVRILEPNAAGVDTVNIATIVHFESREGTPPQAVAILGAWDADIDQRIFANGTDLAQNLLGRSIGDEVEIDGVKAKIASIEAWGG
ncbi:MAG: GreA/GreB family elongation factor [Thermoanaerobaculales bacterium]|nr:GreA/GreB family elongation factor [Thermoanaerobaculales bacterium]